MKINHCYIENNMDTMRRMPDGFVDLVVTSPPYDNLRQYGGYTFDFAAFAPELFRVIKPGGVVVWVVADAVINGSESGTSFRQALGFMQAGFRLHDTMIYLKNGSSFPAAPDDNRYSQVFEFMFVFSKGKPKTANLICDKKNRWAGARNFGDHSVRNTKGDLLKRQAYAVKPISPRENVWKIQTGKGYTTTDEIAFKHPAIFPESLAADHIRTWSLPGELVYDPFFGSGTTGKMAMLLNRNWIGSEINADYVERIALPRLQKSCGLIYEPTVNHLPEEGLFAKP